jgi:hypothetical protein
LARGAARASLMLLDSIDGTVDLLRQRFLRQVVRLAQAVELPAECKILLHDGPSVPCCGYVYVQYTALDGQILALVSLVVSIRRAVASAEEGVTPGPPRASVTRRAEPMPEALAITARAFACARRQAGAP